MMKNILIVVDAQNDFINGSLRNEEAIKAVPRIVDKIMNNEYDAVITTYDTHDRNYMSSREGSKLPVEHCIFGTYGWQIEDSIYKALKNVKTHFDVKKPTFGSFDLVDLVESLCLGSRDVCIELVGFCTDICVVSNALLLKAKLYETADIKVDASCCAGVTVEKHNAALEVMRSCQIDVVNCE